MAVKLLREGRLSPYTEGIRKQELYWLVDSKWAISNRSHYDANAKEVLEDVVELFRAISDKNYACGYRFQFSLTASSLAGLQDICWGVLDVYPTLVEAGAVLDGFSFGQTEPIDLSYCGEKWQGPRKGRYLGKSPVPPPQEEPAESSP